MLQLSFDLSNLVLALASIPGLLFLLFNAVGLVITMYVALSLLVGLTTGVLLYGLLSIALLPFVSVGAAGVLVWLLVGTLTKDEQPKAQG